MKQLLNLISIAQANQTKWDIIKEDPELLTKHNMTQHEASLLSAHQQGKESGLYEALQFVSLLCTNNSISSGQLNKETPTQLEVKMSNTTQQHVNSTNEEQDFPLDTTFVSKIKEHMSIHGCSISEAKRAIQISNLEHQIFQAATINQVKQCLLNVVTLLKE